MEIEKLIQESYEELIGDPEFSIRLKKKIKDEIEKNINSAITSYEIGRKIEKEFGASLGNLISSLNFSQYNLLMVEKVNEVAAEIFNRDFAEKVTDSFTRQFLTKLPEEISIYDIFMKLVQYALNGHSTYSGSEFDGEFVFNVSNREIYGNSHFVDIEFSPTKGEGPKYVITLHRDYDNNDKFRVLSITKDGRRFFYNFNPVANDHLEEFIASLYLSNGTVISFEDLYQIPKERDYASYEEEFSEEYY